MKRQMVLVVAVLLGCQLAGEVLTVALRLPLPGPVLGMAILFGGLLLYGRVPHTLGLVADDLLANLSLLFVPAGVGVMQHAGLLAANGWLLAATLVGSTVLTLGITGGVMQWASRQAGAGEAGVTGGPNETVPAESVPAESVPAESVPAERVEGP